MKTKILSLAFLLVFALSTSAFADGETGSGNFTDGETGIGNIVTQIVTTLTTVIP